MVMPDLNSLERRVALFVSHLYDSPELPHYPFHNLSHTRQVVRRVREMARHYSLSGTEGFILVAAAWFHDVGHLYGPMTGHEERGVVIMRSHLRLAAAD